MGAPRVARLGRGRDLLERVGDRLRTAAPARAPRRAGARRRPGLGTLDEAHVVMRGRDARGLAAADIAARLASPPPDTEGRGRTPARRIYEGARTLRRRTAGADRGPGRLRLARREPP